MTTRATPSTLNVREKEAAAWQLRLAKVPYGRIAAQVGYADGSGAQRAVARYADRNTTENAPLRRRQMDDELSMVLERLARVVVQPPPRLHGPGRHEGQPIMVDGRALLDQSVMIAAATAFMRTQESQRKLLGLDAASKYEVTGADGGPVTVEQRQVLVLGILDKIVALAPAQAPALEEGEVEG